MTTTFIIPDVFGDNDIITPIVKLAVTTDDKEHPKQSFKALPDEIREALEVEFRNAKAAAVREAALAIVQLYKMTDARIEASRRKIREARHIIKVEKARLDGIDAARNHGEETSNYIPLIKSVFVDEDQAYSGWIGHIKRVITECVGDHDDAATKLFDIK